MGGWIDQLVSATARYGTSNTTADVVQRLYILIALLSTRRFLFKSDVLSNCSLSSPNLATFRSGDEEASRDPMCYCKVRKPGKALLAGSEDGDVSLQIGNRSHAKADGRPSGDDVKDLEKKKRPYCSTKSAIRYR